MLYLEIERRTKLCSWRVLEMVMKTFCTSFCDCVICIDLNSCRMTLRLIHSLLPLWPYRIHDQLASSWVCLMFQVAIFWTRRKCNFRLSLELQMVSIGNVAQVIRERKSWRSWWGVELTLLLLTSFLSFFQIEKFEEEINSLTAHSEWDKYLRVTVVLDSEEKEWWERHRIE